MESDADLETHLDSFNQFLADLTRTMDQLKAKMGNSRIEKEALNERRGSKRAPLTPLVHTLLFHTL